MLPDDCKNCKKEKTIFFTQIIDGKIKKFDLCADCPYAQAVNDPTGFGLAEQLTAAGVHMDEQSAGAGLACPACGFTMGDFRKTGRLGCSECYSTFRPAIESVLKTMHRGMEHKGRAPKNLREELELTATLDKLSGELEQAVAREDYEKAAKIRDLLRDTQRQMDILKGVNPAPDASRV